MANAVKLTGKESEAYLLQALVPDIIEWAGCTPTELAMFKARENWSSFKKISNLFGLHTTTTRNQMRSCAIRYLKEELWVVADVLIKESPPSSPVTQDVLNIVNSIINNDGTLVDVCKALKEYRFCKQAVSNLVVYRKYPLSFFKNTDVANIQLLTLKELHLKTWRTFRELKILLSAYSASEIIANRELYYISKTPNYCSEESAML